MRTRGSYDPRAAYYIQGGDESIYFTGHGVTFALTDAGDGAGDEKPSSEALLHPASYRGMGGAKEHGSQREAERWVVKLDFVNANPDVRPVGQEPTAAVISYFKGPREEWTTGLPTYASLVYRDLWPGIDLVYTGTGSRLKYTFLVQPGADPNQIKLAYRGASAVRINAAGQLEVSTPLGGFQEDKPYVYQEVEGQRLEVAAAYSLESEASDGVQFGFRLGACDPQKVLVLDPVVVLYAGYIGGVGDDSGNGIAVDSTGNAYVTGFTYSTEATFPVTVGPDLTFNGDFGTNAFVAKVNPSGTALIYAGYIGGSSGNQVGLGIAVDSTGNAYVTGRTTSSEGTFPVTVGPDLTFNGGGQFGGDAFVAKVNPMGTALLYAGYIGGSRSETLFGGDIAVDSTGNAYVTGGTFSTEGTFPVTVGPDLTFNGGGQFGGDAFVAKIGDEPLGPPTLPANSVVNGASFRPATEPDSAIAPGAIVAIFGADLASDTQVATVVPLPTTLGDTRVTFNDIPAPPFFVSGRQINAQVPFELMAGTGSVTVQVTRGTESSEAQPIAIAAVSPGIFTLNQQGIGPGAILHAGDFQPVNDSAPAQPGEFILIFCTGLGSVQPEVPSGDVAPTVEPLARTVTLPMVNIAGIAADVTFSGLAPGFVGLYQVNVQVPAGVPSGTQEVEIIIDGVPSNTVTIAVE